MQKLNQSAFYLLRPLKHLLSMEWGIKKRNKKDCIYLQAARDLAFLLKVEICLKSKIHPE